MSNEQAPMDRSSPFRAQIRSFNWDDLRQDHPLDLPINLRMVVGPLGADGEELFDISICTMEAIRSLLDRDGVLFPRHRLIVDGVNPHRIEAILRDRISRISGNTWSEVAEKIGRIAYSEFEDYTATS